MPLLPNISGEDDGGPKSLSNALILVEEYHKKVRAHYKKISEIKTSDATGAYNMYAYADDLLCWIMDLLRRIPTTEGAEKQSGTIAGIHQVLHEMHDKLDAELKKLQNMNWRDINGHPASAAEGETSGERSG